MSILILLCKARRKLNEQSDYLNQLLQKTQEGSEGNARELTNATQDSTEFCINFRLDLHVWKAKMLRTLKGFWQWFAAKTKISTNFGKNHLEASNIYLVPSGRCSQLARGACQCQATMTKRLRDPSTKRFVNSAKTTWQQNLCVKSFNDSWNSLAFRILFERCVSGPNCFRRHKKPMKPWRRGMLQFSYACPN